MTLRANRVGIGLQYLALPCHDKKRAGLSFAKKRRLIVLNIHPCGTMAVNGKLGIC